jgi:hypothetical protein
MRMDQLDGYVLMIQAIVTRSLPHFAHAALADPLNQPERSDAFGRRTALDQIRWKLGRQSPESPTHHRPLKIENPALYGVIFATE